MFRNKRRFQEFSDRACAFCAKKGDPDYKQVDDLVPFLTDRGKIIGRTRSGMCARHQRGLTTAVKRARFLALLPFSQRAT